MYDQYDIFFKEEDRLRITILFITFGPVSEHNEKCLIPYFCFIKNTDKKFLKNVIFMTETFFFSDLYLYLERFYWSWWDI